MTTASANNQRISGSARGAGFTLVELMVVLSVTSLLIVAATPSFGTLIRDNKQRAAVMDLSTALNYARVEALRRNRRVVLCPSADPTAANPVCKTTANDGNWEAGWFMFVDDDADFVRDTGEEVVRIGNLMEEGLLLRKNGTATNARRMAFSASGSASGGSNGTFILCDDRGYENAHKIVINLMGRVRSMSHARVSDSEFNASGATSCPSS